LLDAKKLRERERERAHRRAAFGKRAISSEVAEGELGKGARARKSFAKFTEATEEQLRSRGERMSEDDCQLKRNSF